MNTEILPNFKAPMPRPNRNADFINTAAVKVMAEKVAKWLKWCDPKDTTPIQDIETDLLDAMHFDSDGYEIAKRLDQKGWMPDSELVEILDGAWSAKSSAYANACREWVAISGIEAPPIGSAVEYIGKQPQRGGKNESIAGLIGVVTDNDKEGYATVRYTQHGHVEKNAPNGGVLGYCLEWEDLRVVTPELVEPLASIAAGLP